MKPSLGGGMMWRNIESQVADRTEGASYLYGIKTHAWGLVEEAVQSVHK